MGKNAKFEKYKELKFFNKHKMYIFENGLFYITYNEDADKIREIFGFVEKQVGNLYRKCELPVQYFDRYETALNLKKIEYEIIKKPNSNKNRNKIENSFDSSGILLTKVKENDKYLDIIKTIKETNLTSITPIEAMNILVKMQNEIKKEDIH
jgi:DNA mismatch repair ATPase MutS